MPIKEKGLQQCDTDMEVLYSAGPLSIVPEKAVMNSTVVVMEGSGILR